MNVPDPLSLRVCQPITQEAALWLSSSEPFLRECHRLGVDAPMVASHMQMSLPERLQGRDDPARAAEIWRILHELAIRPIRFVLIGGLAGRIYCSSMTTTDVDICHARDTENLRAAAELLRHLNAQFRRQPKTAPAVLEAETLHTEPDFVFTTGLGNLDLIGELTGVGTYPEASANAIKVRIGPHLVPIMSLPKLISGKQSTGRPRDQQVAAELLAVKFAREHLDAHFERREIHGHIPGSGVTEHANGAQRVLQWFEQGMLTRPCPGAHADIVDLSRATASVCGASDLNLSDSARQLEKLIGQHEHLVFVLVDGMGMNLLRTSGKPLPFLKQHVVRELNAIYPSTTAAALTSLGTAAYPSVHGISAWWVYLEEVDAIVEVLPFIERFSRKPMLEWGARPENIFVAPSVLPRMTRDAAVVTGQHIVNSVYSRYWSGGCTGIGYETLADGVQIVAQRLAAVKHPSYTHLYLPQLDATCHDSGIHHEKVQRVLELVDAQMAWLHQQLGGKARLVISADHGHVDAGASKMIDYHDPIMECLKCPPSGEPRAPIFHVRPGCDEQFVELFKKSYGKVFALLSIAELEDLKLVGEGRLTPAARRHFGDYIAISGDHNTLHYTHPQVKPIIHKGVHAA